MRNWNWSWTGNRRRGIQVFRLPMRNWNSRMILGEINLSHCFQTTYEELKLLFPSFLLTGEDIVFRLPMRNWNIGCVRTPNPSEMFSDYLWGIETLKHDGSLSSDGLFSDYLWGIETFLCCDISVIISGFQTTYEELKLDTEKIDKAVEIVFRLPMRNWNTKTHYVWIWVVLVFRLPMRNWNFPPEVHE